MKTHAIVPAVLATAPSGSQATVPYSPLFDDVYHSTAGAFEQAEHVFMRGNQLPARWQGRQRFVILETGFGLGNNFLATWAAWRQDRQRCERLVFISIEKHPLTQADLARVHANSPQPELAQALVAAWPTLTPNLHSLTFDDSRVQLLLGLGDMADVLPAIVAEVDAFYLDGFAPAKNPEMWHAQSLKRLSRLAAPGGTAATWSVARAVRDGLSLAGFDVTRAPGFANKRDMLTARFAPRHVPARPAGAPRTPQCERRALVIGAGLAGCAAAWALAEQGWSVTVLDRHAEPAAEASGNPAGLFHGVIHGDDGVHARLHRAAALTTARLLRPWIEQGRIAGQCQGLLRLEPRLTEEQASDLLNKLGLPPSFVTWLDQSAAQAASGLPVPSGGWLFGDGGWVNPVDYCRTMLQTSGAQFIGNSPVDKLSRIDDMWCALNASGEPVAKAPVVVVACGPSTPTLVPAPAAVNIRLAPVRGQISWLPSASSDGNRHPIIPVAGAGYVLETAGDARLVFGATSHHHDLDPTVRADDHLHNIQQVCRLGVIDHGAGGPQLLSALAGRVGWRAVTPDRLPIVGPVPRPNRDDDTIFHADQPRHCPRLQDAAGGLHLIGGFGSRGITWAALAGRTLASWVTGCPSPIEADLLYAMDPARRAIKLAATPPDEMP